MAVTIENQKMLIGGEWVTGMNTIDVWNPENNELIAQVPAATEKDAQQAIAAGIEGAKISAGLAVHERINILTEAANWVEKRQQTFAETIASEGSKTIREARKEVRRCIETLRISAEEARRLRGETISFDQMPGNEDRAGYYYRFPIGLVVAITPFNDPLNLVAHKIGPAIAAGNAIIVKPSSATPLSSFLLAQAFLEAGLPPKVLSVITGHSKDIGDVLISHPGVSMVTFTGGVKAGEVISKKTGLKKVSMELGSNSPVIVLEDADLKGAVPSIVSGSFWAAGQNCLGVQRVFIAKEIYDDFVEQMVTAVKNYCVGSKFDESTDMGPLITENEAVRVETLVQEAVDMGAACLTGGVRNGAFYTPTILAEVPQESRIAQEEIFGPVVLLYKVKDLEEAVDRSNESPYGLQAGIFTKNIDRAFSAIKTLEVGGVMINDSSDYRIDAMPFGGIKQSGIGREGVAFSIQEMTETKVVCFKLSNEKGEV
jgi:glyceraldehyde-3-phosphate dehydrogenase (NADP+)